MAMIESVRIHQSFCITEAFIPDCLFLYLCTIPMIRVYVKRTYNVHNIYTMNIGIPKHKNTYDFLVQVRNFLLPLSLKVIRHKERDTHSFYSGFSICPHHARHPSQDHWPGFGEKAKANRLLPRQDSTQLNKLTFSKSPKSSARFLRVTSPALCSPVSHLGYWDISEWHVPPHAPVNTCVNVAPKSPRHWAERFSA